MEARSRVLANLGGRVREERTKRGLSQEVLAALAGLNRNYINQLEAGRRNVSIVNLVKIAEALGADLSVLISGIAKA